MPLPQGLSATGAPAGSRWGIMSIATPKSQTRWRWRSVWRHGGKPTRRIALPQEFKMKISQEMKMAKVKQLSGQPVTTGFVVRKRWRTKKIDQENHDKVTMVPHEKTISQAFMAR